MAGCRRTPPAPVDEALRRPEQKSRSCGRCAKSGLGATALRPRDRPTRGRAGKTPRCRPSASATTCASCVALSTRTATTAPLYGHFGQGCVHTRINFDLTTADGIAKLPRVLEEAADLVVALRRLALGRARRRPVARRASAEDVRRRSGRRPSASSRRSGIPTGQMNPGKVVDAYRVDENLRLGPDYEPPRADDALRTIRDDDGDFARRRCAASASASAGEHGAARCAPATWSRGKRCTRRAAARGCCSR